MEALLRIIELSEKEGAVGNEKISRTGERGVYYVDIAKEDGYARDGVRFFEPDTMHSWMIVNGDMPAFPALEDMPRNERVSFDVYYIMTPERVAHRITLTRSHGPYKSFVKACFVDGNLVYVCGAGRSSMKVLLFNPKEWNSGANREKLPHFWFHLGNLRIDVLSDVYSSVNRMLWTGLKNRTPDHYGLFINERSTLTGETLWVQQKQHSAHFWPAMLLLFILFPIWFVYQLALSLVITPARMCHARCQVRKYVIQERELGDNGKRGSFRLCPAYETIEPGETTRLLA